MIAHNWLFVREIDIGSSMDRGVEACYEHEPSPLFVAYSNTYEGEMLCVSTVPWEQYTDTESGEPSADPHVLFFDMGSIDTRFIPREYYPMYKEVSEYKERN